MDRARFDDIAAGFARARVLIIGDLMLDEFIWGRVSRISPEAPIPVVNVTAESYYPGGAANVARNVREFRAATAVMGVTGADAAGERLLKLLEDAAIDVSAVERDAAVRTTVKTRIIARHQQVVRVDRESRMQMSERQTAEAMRRLDRILPEVDAVIVADYGKGYLTQPLADHICRTARAYRKILTVDPHPHTFLCWRDATAIKPNRAEAFSAAGMTATESGASPLEDGTLLEAARRLQSAWNPESLLITLGEQGMLLFQGGADALHIPTRAQDVFDVSGAGDTALAVFTLALQSGATPPEAADLANRASGIAVGKLGTATVTVAELAAGFSGA
jgi:D-beta-D-heptose 7-phosphate kinase/D-beta-D-heptose 1-phosphate adenosyltransferase